MKNEFTRFEVLSRLLDFKPLVDGFTGGTIGRQEATWLGLTTLLQANIFKKTPGRPALRKGKIFGNENRRI